MDELLIITEQQTAVLQEGLLELQAETVALKETVEAQTTATQDQTEVLSASLQTLL
jgi:hypothetical protein